MFGPWKLEMDGATLWLLSLRSIIVGGRALKGSSTMTADLRNDTGSKRSLLSRLRRMMYMQIKKNSAIPATPPATPPTTAPTLRLPVAATALSDGEIVASGAVVIGVFWISPFADTKVLVAFTTVGATTVDLEVVDGVEEETTTTRTEDEVGVSLEDVGDDDLIVGVGVSEEVVSVVVSTVEEDLRPSPPGSLVCEGVWGVVEGEVVGVLLVVRGGCGEPPP